MNVAVFGATGMVGGGVLLECLEDARVKSVLSVSRRASGMTYAKLRELQRADLTALGDDAKEFANIDACFFCLGVTAVGMSEDAYRRVTLDLTMNVARLFARLNPQVVFCYVSGSGTDRHGRAMWARVKGETENQLLELLPRAFMFRPGIIQPLKGVRSSTPLYQRFYTLAKPLFPILNVLFAKQITTTVKVGRAMIAVAASGYPKRILETDDINNAAR